MLNSGRVSADVVGPLRHELRERDARRVDGLAVGQEKAAVHAVRRRVHEDERADVEDLLRRGRRGRRLVRLVGGPDEAGLDRRPLWDVLVQVVPKGVRDRVGGGIVQLDARDLVGRVGDVDRAVDDDLSRKVLVLDHVDDVEHDEEHDDEDDGHDPDAEHLAAVELSHREVVNDAAFAAPLLRRGKANLLHAAHLYEKRDIYFSRL